jgi:hydrogenase maturation protease
MTAEPECCVVIGVGNPDRGDDLAGRAVARRLSGTVPDGVRVAESDGEATALIERFDGAASAYLVDACLSGASAGTVRRFDVADGPLPQDLFDVSTHGFGLAQAIELARALGQLPPRCIVYAIEGGSFELGAPITPSVAGAVNDVTERLRDEIAGLDRKEQQEPCTKPR